jgi:hypothetical protein
MNEHPIIFSGAMVRAILAGKTQTRRVIKPQPKGWGGEFQDDGFGAWCIAGDQDYSERIKCPYGKVGDHLWVRETWRIADESSATWTESGFVTVEYADGTTMKTDECVWNDNWHQWWEKYIKSNTRKGHPSIFMPKWASRLSLKITGIRVERVQDITVRDVRAEGWPAERYLFPGVNESDKCMDWFRKLWDSINGKRGYSWESNPWCWCISFRRVAI